MSTVSTSYSKGVVETAAFSAGDRVMLADSECRERRPDGKERWDYAALAQTGTVRWARESAIGVSWDHEQRARSVSLPTLVKAEQRSRDIWRACGQQFAEGVR
jgi:hypothetical protein